MKLLTQNYLAVIILFASVWSSLQTSYAVELSDNGHGDAALFQYYSAKNDWQTFIRIINDSAYSTATKVRFREAANGRAVLDFVLFLGPYDEWIAWTDQNALNNSPGIRTNDASCITSVTASPSPISASFTSLNSTTKGAKFDASSFTGQYNDDGILADDDKIRSRLSEGSIEVIGLASFSPSSSNQSVLRFIDYISPNPSTGMPHDCTKAKAEFSTLLRDGEQYLNLGSTFDYRNHMAANAYLVNITSGQGASYSPRILSNFSNTSLIAQAVSTDTKPDLDSATTTSTWTNKLSRVIQHGRVGQTLTTGGVDSVSAVLMSTNVTNEWALKKSTDPNSVFKDSFTQWVVSFPTKQFYVDLQSDADLTDDISPTLGDHSSEDIAWTPFINEFGNTDPLSESRSCSPFTIHIRNREGEGKFFLASNGLCYQTNVISFGNESAAKGLASRFSTVIPTSALPSNATNTAQAKLGSANIKLTQNNISFTNDDNKTYYGLPVDGFMFYNYEGSDRQSNYTTILPHKYFRKATTNP